MGRPAAQRPVDHAAPAELLRARRDEGDADARRDESDDRLHEPDVVLHGARREARLAADVEDLRVKPRHAVTRREDEGLVGEAADVDAPVPGQGMVLGERDQECLPRDDGLVEERILEREVEEADVEAPLVQRANEVVGRHLAQVDVHCRVCPSELAEQRRKRRVGRGGHEADGEAPDRPGPRPAHELDGLLHAREQPMGLSEEDLARLGQANRTPRAIEEPDAQLALESADLDTERRLRDAQTHRGAREAQLLGDGREVAQVAKFHSGRRCFGANKILDASVPRSNNDVVAAVSHLPSAALADVCTAAQAATLVPRGATIMVGGFGLVGKPLALVEALMGNPEAADLTVISNNLGEPGKGLGQLLREGRVSKAIGSFFTSNPDAVQAHVDGRLEVELLPQGTMSEAIRAGGAGIGAFYVRTGVGTKIAEGKEVRDFGGLSYLLQRALHADIALVRARAADELGNLVYEKTARNFNPDMATAADVVVAQVDEIVPVGAFDPEAVVTPHLLVDHLVLTRPSA